jgi:hypothetical protein
MQDRREISGLLLKYFPTMETASSEEWHYFLDKMTGLETPLDMSNGQAFDQWRMALQEQGYPVWKYTPKAIEAMQARAAEMKAAEEKRAADLGTTLVELAKEAPSWPVADVLAESRTEVRK